MIEVKPTGSGVKAVDVGKNTITVGVDTWDGNGDAAALNYPVDETITATTTIRNQRLDEWWVTHLQNNQRTTMRLDFYARVDVAGDSVTIPLRNVTHTIETDMFDNKPDDGTSGDGSDTGDNEEDTTTASAPAAWSSSALRSTSR